MPEDGRAAWIKKAINRVGRRAVFRWGPAFLPPVPIESGATLAGDWDHNLFAASSHRFGRGCLQKQLMRDFTGNGLNVNCRQAEFMR